MATARKSGDPERHETRRLTYSRAGAAGQATAPAREAESLLTTDLSRLGALLMLGVLVAGCTVAAPAAPRLTASKPAAPARSALPTPAPHLLPPESPPPGAAAEFSTDWRKHSVPYGEILSGGPPKDGIPALDHPRFISVRAADRWLKPVEPVLALQIGGDARAYPLQVLIWHEIANDTVGGVPVAVTFCPLCNTGIAFERTVQGRVLDFGTTGRLHYSNLLMYDRQTETWWQQATGEAIAGALTGTQLVFRPAAIVAWADFRLAHPDGRVLSRETGYARPYGHNPYAGYDDVRTPPFLYTGPATPKLLPPVARVLTLNLRGEAVAYPYDVLRRVRVVNDVVGGVPVVILWTPGTASALDASTVANGRDVGAATAFARTLTGRTLTFRVVHARIVDSQTGSVWTLLGRAVQGPLAGRALRSVVAVNHFWFSWAAFRPATRVYRP